MTSATETTIDAFSEMHRLDPVGYPVNTSVVSLVWPAVQKRIIRR